MTERTYELGSNYNGEEYIKCLRCERKSYYAPDIENKYCGKCGFHGTHVSHPEHAISPLHLAQRHARKAFIFATIAILFAIAALVIPIIW